MFLKPNHVLPEFLMHVQIVKQPDNVAHKSQDKSATQLPKNIITLPHFNHDETGPPTESPSSKVKNRKLNDWVSQLNNALNSPNANSLTLVEKSQPEPAAERLAAQTGDLFC